MELLKHVLPWAEIILSILLIGLILVQRSGAELSGALGGGDGSNGTAYTRRGAERILFFATIAVAAIFLALSFAALFISKA